MRYLAFLFFFQSNTIDFVSKNILIDENAIVKDCFFLVVPASFYNLFVRGNVNLAGNIHFMPNHNAENVLKIGNITRNFPLFLLNVPHSSLNKYLCIDTDGKIFAKETTSLFFKKLRSETKIFSIVLANEVSSQGNLLINNKNEQASFIDIVIGNGAGDINLIGSSIFFNGIIESHDDHINLLKDISFSSDLDVNDLEVSQFQVLDTIMISGPVLIQLDAGIIESFLVKNKCYLSGLVNFEKPVIFFGSQCYFQNVPVATDSKNSYIVVDRKNEGQISQIANLTEISFNEVATNEVILSDLNLNKCTLGVDSKTVQFKANKLNVQVPLTLDVSAIKANSILILDYIQFVDDASPIFKTFYCQDIPRNAYSLAIKINRSLTIDSSIDDIFLFNNTDKKTSFFLGYAVLIEDPNDPSSYQVKILSSASLIPTGEDKKNISMKPREFFNLDYSSLSDTSLIALEISQALYIYEKIAMTKKAINQASKREYFFKEKYKKNVRKLESLKAEIAQYEIRKARDEIFFH